MELETMTDQDLGDLIQAAQDELARRQTIETVNKQVADVIKVARRDGAIETPEPGGPWVQPTDATTAYMAGDIVTHNGKTWVATVDYCVWEPGVSGWREQTSDGSPPEWVQPSGAADAYGIGERVTYRGKVYESTINANSWSPEDYPQGWKEIS